MLTFFKTLFFGTWITLTPEPVTLDAEPLEILLSEPISALTQGANVRIDISAHISAVDVISQLDQAKEFMEPGCLAAELITTDGSSYTFDKLHHSAGDDSTQLVLSKRLGAPTDVDFVRVTVKSCKKVTEAVVIWSNWAM